LVSALDHVFDDAALFPPARLPMAEALRAHEAAVTGPHARLVGPFLCPLSRLDELDACVAGALPRPGALGVVTYDVAPLGRRPGSTRGLVQIEAPLGARLPDLGGRVRRFLEIPRHGAVGTHLDAVRAAGSSAKVRCGGTGPDDVPSCARVADALVGCVERGLTLKATAGLHQPFRTGGPMGHHGFVNLLAAAAAARAGRDRATVAAVLMVEEPEAHALVDRLARSRDLLVSVGTCSIDEPVAALVERGLL
jgi:hypothetical protein